MAARRVRRVRLTRDLALFIAGLSILLHQAFFAAEVQPELVTAAVALLLAPAVTRVDDATRDRGRNGERDEDNREVEDSGAPR